MGVEVRCTRGGVQRHAPTYFVAKPDALSFRADNSGSGKAGHEARRRSVDEGGGQCFQCHSGDFFTDEKHHVIGFPQIGPGLGDPGNRDFARARQTGSSSDQFAFRTPSLLNVGLTAPYGHAGAYSHLETAFEHYALPQETLNVFLQQRLWCWLPPFVSNRVACNASPSNGMSRINLAAVTEASIFPMVEFLRSLTDPCLLDR